MTSIKAKLIEAIETVPDSILEQTLDYLEYLKTREQKPQTLSQEIAQTEGEPILRGSKAKDLLKFAKTWQGNDFEECLQLVYDTRSQAEF
ncbi:MULTISPECIES: hypothetical protein [unclassified Anabaena]|uniref:hypothetical protein n=1 Tax=unclassified Anabaena TaxID=2619674 RepID=UPI002B220465|nr:hypothetical protein [Anabaena sp. UHCC 0399]MEA5568947.1 hypothetical protein [Anabaena sp. UHCC 0399]